uniref:Kelch domain-containing protein 10 n=1 Tax=Syphacia muris TaxID=451379 RepID=A0A0N5AJQ9_9BILA
MDLSQFNSVNSDVCGRRHATRKKSSELYERSGHRMICDRNYVYVVGGFSSSPFPHLYEEIWRFNLLSDTWEKLDISRDQFPREMASHASQGENILVCTDLPSGSNFLRAFMFGGTSFPFGKDPSDQVHVLDRIDNNTFAWRRLITTGDFPIRQYGSCIVFHKDVLYLIGGTTGYVYNMEVRSLSPLGLNEGDETTVWDWKLLKNGFESGLTGRYRHETIVVNDDILIIGGGNTQWVAGLDKILTFSINDNCFKALLTYPDAEHGFPEGRMCHACLLYDRKIYVIGGCSAINPETQDGCIYVFGGALDGQFQVRCNLLQRMWLRPPPLQYLCQRAVIKLFSKLFSSDIDSIT